MTTPKITTFLEHVRDCPHCGACSDLAAKLIEILRVAGKKA
jgi:hypothetical protein